LNCYKKL